MTNAKTDKAINNMHKRPVGRPRADGQQHLTRDALLKTTAKLVAANGYTGTSIRMIAKELDVTTASIFNIYGSKDKLLNGLIAFAASHSFAFYEKLNAMSLPPEIALFKSILEEVKAVSSVDRDYVAIFYLPELRRPEFKESQAVRARMVAHYRTLIAKGVRNGKLKVDDPDWMAEQIFQLTETSIVAGPMTNSTSVENQAIQTARFCLKGILVGQSDLVEIENTSLEVDAAIEIL